MIEVMKQALEALEEYQRKGAPFLSCDAAAEALRQAIEQAEQAQPVAWLTGCPECGMDGECGCKSELPVPHCEAGPEYCPVCYKELNPEPAIYPDEAYEMGLEEVAFYTSSPQRQPLTDEEIRDLWSWSMTTEAERAANTQQHAFARAIEAAHGITKGEA